MLVRMTMLEASELWCLMDAESEGPAHEPYGPIAFSLSNQLDKTFGGKWIEEMPEEVYEDALKIIDSIRAQKQGLVPNTDSHYSFEFSDADVGHILGLG